MADWATLLGVIAVALFVARELHEAEVIPSILQEVAFMAIGILGGFVVSLLVDEGGESG